MCAVLISPRAFRIDITRKVTVIARIGIDDAADRAMFGGNFGFDTAPRAAVAGNYDLAFHINAPALERFVILRNTVVHVDQLSRDITVNRIRVVGGQLLGFLSRSGVLFEHRLFQFCGEPFRRGHFENAGFGGREQNVETFDLRVVAPGSEKAGDEIRILLTVGRSHMVWPGR